jgi:hypothetical protein
MAEKNQHFKKVSLIPQNEWNKKYGQIEVSPKYILIRKTIFIGFFDIIKPILESSLRTCLSFHQI